MPLLNVFLILSLICAQDFAAGRYGFFSQTSAYLALLTLILGSTVWGVARLLALASSGANVARREVTAAALCHTWVSILALSYFVSGAQLLPGTLAAMLGSAAAANGVCVLGAIAIFGVLRWVPRRLVGSVLACSLGAALFVALGEGALARLNERSPAALTEGQGAPPNVYYIVLDSQIGLASFPGDVDGARSLSERIRADYLDWDFELYDRAFANSMWTGPSLYSLFDNELHGPPPQTSSGVNQIPRNRLFEEMSDRGYRLRIHQSSYLDFCSAAPRAELFCSEYPVDHLGSDDPTPEELYLLLIGLAGRVVVDSEWQEARRLLGVTNALDAFQRVIADVREHRRGEFVFAHLLIPHEPFVLGPDCELGNPPAFRYYKGRIGRAEAGRRWSRYLGQVECTHKLVARFVEALREAGIFEESTIVVHGDHGSRISMTGPFGPRGTAVDGRLFLDFYSSLFALKRGEFELPDLGDQGRETWASLSGLLSGLMGWAPASGLEYVHLKDPRRQYVPQLEEADALLLTGPRTARP